MMKKKPTIQPLAVGDEPPLMTSGARAPQVVANEAPVKIVIDEAPEGEEEREEAFAGVYEWKGQELLPYTPTKRGMWERLCVLDVPMPANVELKHLEAYVPQALKLLYLLTHPTEDYAHLRPRPTAFLSEIDRWIDATCSHADMLPAVNLALKVHNAALKNVAVPSPSPTGKGGSSGN